MKILVTGATGFIGKRICEALVRDKHDLVVLTRLGPAFEERALQKLGDLRCEVVAWDYRKDPVPHSAIHQVDAVISFAGEPVVGARWNDQRKNAIYESRVLATKKLVEGFENLKSVGHTCPSVFITASAVGYYGDRGDSELIESSISADDFLARVCKEWEDAAFKAEALGVRVVALRIGVVLGRGGGALSQMLGQFKAGLGGKVGSGKQWMSWVHVDDVVGLTLFALHDPRVQGVLNATAPNPVRNKEFTKILARVLKRPALLRVPAFVLELAMGEMAKILLCSQRVLPVRARELGFQFKYETLESALRQIVTKV